MGPQMKKRPNEMVSTLSPCVISFENRPNPALQTKSTNCHVVGVQEEALTNTLTESGEWKSRILKAEPLKK